MPSRVLEVVLITLILFFVYSFSTIFFQEIILKNSLEDDILKYISNNFFLCLTITNSSYGFMRCNLGFEYKDLNLISGGDYFTIRYSGKYYSPILSLSSIFNKRVYGISGKQNYMKNNIENITID